MSEKYKFNLFFDEDTICFDELIEIIFKEYIN